MDEEADVRHAELRDVGDLAVGKVVLEFEPDDFALVRAQRVEQMEDRIGIFALLDGV